MGWVDDFLEKVLASMKAQESTGCDPHKREASLFDHTDHEVYLVTSHWQQRHHGCLVTWVLPLSLCGGKRWFVIALSPLGSTLKAVRHSKRLTLQMLTTAHLPYVVRWGCTSSEESDKFSDFIATKNPAAKHSAPQDPLLIPETVGWIQGKVLRTYPTKERYLVVCCPLAHHTTNLTAPAVLRTSHLKQHLRPQEIERLQLKRRSMHELSSALNLLQESDGDLF